MGIIKITQKKHGNQFYIGTRWSYAGANIAIPAMEATVTTEEYDAHSMQPLVTWNKKPLPKIRHENSVLHQDLYGQVEVEIFPLQIDRGFYIDGKTFTNSIVVVDHPGDYSKEFWTSDTVKYEIKFTVQSIVPTSTGNYTVYFLEGSYTKYTYQPDGTVKKSRTGYGKYNNTVRKQYLATLLNSYPFDEYVFAYWSWLLTQEQVEDLDAAVTHTQEDKLDWGNLCLKATESIRLLDINGLAYIKDAVEIASLCKSLADLNWVKTAKHFATYYKARHTGSIAQKAKKAWKQADGISAVKGAASTYLANHYGSRLMVKDTLDIAKAIDKADFQKDFQRCGETVDWVYPGRFGFFDDLRGYRKVTCDIRSWSDQQLEGAQLIGEAANQLGDRLLRLGYELDVLPSPSNLWDLVPWSFAIDWFIPIGDALERQESIGYLHSLRPVRVFCSSKFTATKSEYTQYEGARIKQDLHWRCYYRIVTREFPSVPIMSDYPWFSLQSHWLEATALVVQVTAR